MPSSRSGRPAVAKPKRPVDAVGEAILARLRELEHQRLGEQGELLAYVTPERLHAMLAAASAAGYGVMFRVRDAYIRVGLYPPGEAKPSWHPIFLDDEADAALELLVTAFGGVVGVE